MGQIISVCRAFHRNVTTVSLDSIFTKMTFDSTVATMTLGTFVALDIITNK
jgi:hypothetical protein